jgi:hypothetical protein
VPEVAPASSCWDGAVPGAAGEGNRDGADTHHLRALTPGAGTEGPSRGKTLSPPRHEGKCPSGLGFGLSGLGAPADQGRRLRQKPEPGWGLPSRSCGWWVSTT